MSASITHDDLEKAVCDGITNHPRSLQQAIGPSELGTPCTRKLGFKLAGTPQVRQRNPLRQWRPTVGTAVHAWLEQAVVAYNESHSSTRFLVESTLSVGDVDGTEIHGHCDLFDLLTATVVDWKIVGPTSLKAARKGPKPTYRAQAHLYGRGWERKGYHVKHVAVYWLPSAGDLSEGVWWSEPYDESLALAVLSRASAIAQAIRLVGADSVLGSLETVDDYCTSCEWFSPRGNGVTSCGGPGADRRESLPSVGDVLRAL